MKQPKNKASKRGRPFVDKSEKRKFSVQTTLTKEELEQFNELRCGQSPSAFVRKCIFER